MSGGGTGNMITPKMLLRQIHEQELSKAKEYEEMVQMEAKMRQNEKCPPRDVTGKFKRKVNWEDNNKPEVQKKLKTETKISEKQRKIDENKSMATLDNNKKAEALRLRAKRLEYEKFLKEKIKESKK